MIVGHLRITAPKHVHADNDNIMIKPNGAPRASTRSTGSEHTACRGHSSSTRMAANIAKLPELKRPRYWGQWRFLTFKQDCEKLQLLRANVRRIIARVSSASWYQASHASRKS